MSDGTAKLGEICDFIYGDGLPEALRIPGQVPVYGSNGAVGWHSKAITKGPTLIIGRKGSIGEIHFSQMPCWPIDTTYFVDATKQPCDLLWLYYMLIALDLTKLNKSAAVPGLNRDDAYEKDLLFPPLAEQQRIAAILAKANRLRRLRRYALEISDTYLQSVFLEMFGDPATNPRGWNYLPFGDVSSIDAKMIDPRQEPYCSYLHIGGANIESRTGDLIDLKTAQQEGLISSKFLIGPEHILFSKIRPKLRKVAFPKTHAICSADIYPIKVNPDKCDLYYMLHYLRGDHFSKKVSELAESRTNIPKVNREELAELFIPVPSLTFQNRFAAIVSKHERLRVQQREAARQAEHLFQTLLHRAFRGELAGVSGEVETEGGQRRAI